MTGPRCVIEGATNSLRLLPQKCCARIILPTPPIPSFIIPSRGIRLPPKKHIHAGSLGLRKTRLHTFVRSRPNGGYPYVSPSPCKVITKPMSSIQCHRCGKGEDINFTTGKPLKTNNTTQDGVTLSQSPQPKTSEYNPQNAIALRPTTNPPNPFCAIPEATLTAADDGAADDGAAAAILLAVPQACLRRVSSSPALASQASLLLAPTFSVPPRMLNLTQSTNMRWTSMSRQTLGSCAECYLC